MALYLKYLSINISIDTQILKTVVRVSWEKLVVIRWIKKVFEVAEYFRRRIITIKCIFILRSCICQVPNGVAGFQNIQNPKDLLQSCDHSQKHIFREGFRISNISYLRVKFFLQWSLAELLLGLIWTEIHTLYGLIKPWQWFTWAQLYTSMRRRVSSLETAPYVYTLACA